MNFEFSIDNIKVSPGLVLAPMSGITCSAFRTLIKRENPEAVGLVVTEFISVEALTRKNLRSLEMLRFRPEEKPISVQIFGFDIDRMVSAAQMVEAAGADIIDINCGCPVPKVVRRGGGCELMRQPVHLDSLLSSVRKSIKVPLTVKFRAGWDDNNKNAVEIARLAENCGVAMVCVHPRTRKQMYSGEVDVGLITEVCRNVRIPVIASGDITSIGAAKAYLEAGCAGLMIGRGALRNPWAFLSLCQEFTSGAAIKRDSSEVIRVLQNYTALLCEELPDKAVIGRIKQLAGQATRSIPGSASLRRDLLQSKGLDEFTIVLDGWEKSLQPATVKLEGNG